MDTVIVDPPRTGLDREVISLLEEWKPERIIYISCNPVTASRDLALFSSYYPVKAKVFDCYPGSSHIETVVVLGRQRIDNHISVDLDVKKLGIKSGNATYDDIKAYVREKYGFEVHSAYIGQVKEKLGIRERKNYNVGSGKHPMPLCPPEKEEAIKDALRHFGLI